MVVAAAVDLPMWLKADDSDLVATNKVQVGGGEVVKRMKEGGGEGRLGKDRMGRWGLGRLMGAGKEQWGEKRGEEEEEQGRG